MKKVIDVSSHNGNVDFKKVKADGISGVILRCSVTHWGAGHEIVADQRFEENYKAAIEAGLPVGVYHYSAADTVEFAKKEAAFALKMIKGKKLGYPVYFDTENNERQRHLSKSALTEITKAFCSAVEGAGYYVGIYASSSWFKTELEDEKLVRYDHWVAHYGASKPSYTGAYGMWQYTSAGKVDGIGGKVDMNECYKDYPAVIAQKGLNGYSKPQAESKPAPAKKAVQAGCKVKYTGSLYSDSYGGGKGKTVSGTFTVTRVIANRKKGVLLNNGLGWVAEKDCKIVG